MPTDLRSGFTWRRPTIDDAEPILEVMARHNTPLVGSADFTLSEVRDELVDARFDPAADLWLVCDEAGTAVAYGWALGAGTSDMVDIAFYGPEVVAGWLWEQLLDRAREIGARSGHREIKVDVDIYQNDAAQQARARSYGFAPATTVQRMRIDFDVPPAEPVVPDDVVVRTGPGDEEFRRHAHDVSKRAFVEHFGFVERTFEEWHLTIDSAQTTDWAQLRVAYVDDEAVAMVRGANDFGEDENRGYVATVAVLPGARGRGLAKLLLRQAFVDDFRRGRRGTVLHVDANNVTPAVGLYLSVGMQPVLAIDVWRGQLEVQPSTG